MKAAASLLLLSLALSAVNAQQVAPLWTDFVEARKLGTTPELPDFSYAGYRFSEQEIPDISGKKRFDVTQYGARPNDSQYDDTGIQAAINAAEKTAGGGVVFFPPGKYLIAPDEARNQIRISKSHIVLKGSGSGPGGTEIYQDKKRPGSRQFLFQPAGGESAKYAKITKDALRESFWVEVDDASKLRPGLDVVVRHRSEEYTRDYFAPLQLNPEWTRLFGANGGMLISEIHTVERVMGKRVKFVNPLHYPVKVIEGAPFELVAYNSIEECGIEDILFTSGWKHYPEEFVHHKDAIHDTGWQAAGMENVKNSWVRNCEFRDWNEVLNIRAGYQVSVLNVTFSGKKGHTSIHARTGYGVLIKNCRFNGAQHHGPGTGYSGSGTVVTQCEMGIDQNIDSHSGQPCATLFDDVTGGVFYNLGGPHPGFPHHGRYLVFWNFRHRSDKDRHYNFWDLEKRRNNTIANPIFVGFQPDRKITFENEGVNQLPGVMVEPKSLFEAQLKLRMQQNRNQLSLSN